MALPGPYWYFSRTWRGRACSRSTASCVVVVEGQPSVTHYGYKPSGTPSAPSYPPFSWVLNFRLMELFAWRGAGLSTSLWASARLLQTADWLHALDILARGGSSTHESCIDILHRGEALIDSMRAVLSGVSFETRFLVEHPKHTYCQ